MKIAIFTEDDYGDDFIKRVIIRLRNEGYLKKKIEFYRSGMPAKIEKCRNVGKKVKAVIREVDKVVVVIDKEDVCRYDEESIIWRHFKDLKREDKNKISVVATEPEIEEWICISLDLKFDKIEPNLKPSKVLKQKIRYKKRYLPEYAEKLDFGKLLIKSKSFRKFLEILNGPAGGI